MKKNKDCRFELRLTQEEKILLTYHALRYGCTPSRYLRLMVDSAILPYKKKIQSGDMTYDDFENLCNDKLQYKRLLKK